jgi:hypothetical protein
MDATERDALEQWAAALLELSAADTASIWAHASPPGRFAATVIRLAPVAHRFTDAAARRNIQTVGLKIFKTNRDATRESLHIIDFHNLQLGRLPGLPNAHVQQSVHAGAVSDARGHMRRYVLQEWVEGETLDTLVSNPQIPLSNATCRAILVQLFGSIVAPLWSAGTVWWDFRDANYCFDAATARLSMIDVDSLGAYADEILDRPTDWTRRDKGRVTALSRLRQMSLRLLYARRRGPKSRIQRAFDTEWAGTFEPSLNAMGRSTDDSRDVAAVFAAAINRCLGG